MVFIQIKHHIIADMGNVKVSVICCTYNQKKYIAKCVESLVKQKTNFLYEILIHDDASTDGTIEVLKDFKIKYPDKIKLFIESENQYLNGNPHIDYPLYEIAEGEYFAYCEGDDYWSDEYKLQKQYEVMEKNENCTICLHRVQRIVNTGEMTNSFFHLDYFSDGLISGTEFINRFLDGTEHAPAQTSSFFIRSKLMKKRPKFLELFIVGDYPMLLYACSKGDLYYLKDVMSCYRLGTPNGTHDLMKEKAYALQNIKANIDGFSAFNQETNYEFERILREKINYYKLQLYYATGKNLFTKDELKEIKRRMELKKIIISRIKFTFWGNYFRNLKGKLLIKKRIKEVNS